MKLQRLLRQEAAWLAVELQTPAPYALAAAGASMAYAAAFTPATIFILTLLALLLSLQALVDARRTMLPHSLNAAIFVLGLICAPTLLNLPILHSLLAPCIAFAALWGIAALTAQIIQKPARTPVIGGGDFWLVAALAPWLGLAGLAPFLAYTAIIGLFVVAARQTSQRRNTQKPHFPFGPTLAAAGWLAILYGDLYWHHILPH